jgi:hypothetical protein
MHVGIDGGPNGVGRAEDRGELAPQSWRDLVQPSNGLTRQREIGGLCGEDLVDVTLDRDRVGLGNVA